MEQGRIAENKSKGCIHLYCTRRVSKEPMQNPFGKWHAHVPIICARLTRGGIALDVVVLLSGLLFVPNALFSDLGLIQLGSNCLV
jgi:hypothetical protein